MVKKQIVRDEADTKDLLNTYSDENWKLKQVETGKIYGHSVTDDIVGYDGGKPYGRYTYKETDEQDEEEDDELL